MPQYDLHTAHNEKKKNCVVLHIRLMGLIFWLFPLNITRADLYTITGVCCDAAEPCASSFYLVMK